jgi:hypothetical protein
VLVVRDREPDALADDLHVAVVNCDAGNNARELLVASDVHEPAEELGAEALTLKGVGDENGELRLVRAPQLHQTADGEDGRLPGRVALLRHERHLARVR